VAKQRVLIFSNPTSGAGKGARIAERLRIALGARGWEVLPITQPTTHLSIEQLGSLLGDQEVGAAVCVGGDGTLRSAAQALYRWRGGSMPPILVLPLGTANLMARHLGVQWRDATIVEDVESTLLDPRVRLLDAATCNQSLFLLMVGVGIDALVVHELHRIRYGPISRWNYVLPSIRALAGYKFTDVTVICDGQQVFDRMPGLVFVGNVPEYGAGFPVLVDAKSDDSSLDLCVLPCRNQRELIDLLFTVASRAHLQHEGIVYRKCSAVRIESAEPVPVQVDGDPMGFTPVDIQLLPDKLPFIVPPST
jgi:diacylglycerol kinase family enzyme